MTERLHFHFSLSCIGEGNGNPLQHSCLENPRDKGAWWAAVYGVTQSWTWLTWLSSSNTNIRGNQISWFCYYLIPPTLSLCFLFLRTVFLFKHDILVLCNQSFYFLSPLSSPIIPLLTSREGKIPVPQCFMPLMPGSTMRIALATRTR